MDPSEMTAVYSGGLLYEYALEPNNYGIVKISGSSVSELGDFQKFASALSKYPPPSGNGGFTSTTKAMACPTKDSDWLVDSTLLPAIPDNAKSYLSNGAGPGPGLKGGSQDAGGNGTSTGSASPGSGTVTATGSSKNEGGVPMGPMDKSPFIISAIVLLCSLFGTLIL